MNEPVQGINHLGIAVRSIEENRDYYEKTLGAKFEGVEVVEDQKVKVAFYRVGDTRLELLEPTSEDSPIAKYIEKRGEGIHHVAFTVDNLQNRIDELKAAGLKMIDEEARAGAHKTHIAFAHPKSTHGVLTELTQPVDNHRAVVSGRLDQIKKRESIKKHAGAYPVLTPEEAAEVINDGDLVGFSGFTPAGAAKATPRAVAARAKVLHAEGKPFKIRVLSGASTGDDLDEALAQANAMSWRAPYQSSKTYRKQMNNGEVGFVDMHLSHMPQMLAEGFLGEMDVAVVEATDVTADGRVFLTTSVGAAPTFLQQAKKVIIEINRYHSPRVSQLADVAILPNPPLRRAIPLYHPMDRIGWPYATVEPDKIVGIVETNQADGIGAFTPPDAVSQKIANNVIEFLLNERAKGRIPEDFLPMQSGVGNVANAMLAGLNANEDVPPFYMYTEVLQDSVMDLIRSGKVIGASTSALTISDGELLDLYENMDFFQSRVMLRPQEISNNPGVVRRMGVISSNTALEVDIYGHVNSTHVLGRNMMNGLGGSGDFTRNAYLSFFMCPSVAKGGKISAIVPFCSHIDHNEHSVQIVVTEQGIADLRGKAPDERALALIENCAHPAYRPYLRKYLEDCPPGHIRQNLSKAFELHINLEQQGQMIPDMDMSVFG